MTPIRLFLIEDQPTTLRNLEKILSKSPHLEVLGGAKSAEDAIQSINNMEELPHVVLCDIGLPKMSGIEFCRFIKVKHPEIEVLMLTIFDDPQKALEAIRYGASGYLLKGIETSKVVEAIREVHEGGSVIQPGLARQILKRFQPRPHARSSSPQAYRKTLTDRERDCLQIIAKGLSNIEAANVLGLSKATIRTHLEHIYQKLDVGNRVEAVTEGLRQGLIGI
ncbi:MAG: response regulator transcription factor [Deltaproteobacteria bacterium]|nr:response regulator transcription factor [Deltaproteobacteria bacterium]